MIQHRGTTRPDPEARNSARDGGALICAQQKGSGAKADPKAQPAGQLPDANRSPGPEPLITWSQGFFLPGVTAQDPGGVTLDIVN